MTFFQSTRTLSVLVAFALGFPLAASAAPAECFDFNAPIKVPLKAPIALGSKKDATASGKGKDKGFWGAVRGLVKKPIRELYAQLLDHYTIKDPKRVKLKVYDQERAGFKDFHVVMIALETPLTTVHWEEDWGYVVTQGTSEDPKSIVISYQKTDGTQFIPHLCGSIVLTAVSSDTTDVYLYEEVDALGKRSPKDTITGHLGTLATLRGARAAASTP